MNVSWITAAAGAAAAVGMAAGAGLLRSRYERDQLSTEKVVIRSPKLRTPRTLVFLSDLHDKEFGTDNCRLLQAIADIRPDAVLIGGDTMVAKHGKAELRVTEQLLHGLYGLSSEKGRIPVFYGNGNHEQRFFRESEHYGTLGQEFRKLLETYQVRYLSDSSQLFGEDIRISGLNLDVGHYRDLVPEKLTAADIEKKLGTADETRFQILLAHSPLFHRAYGQWGADLSLAGHFHGGTIRLPLLGGVMTPQYQFFLPCCAGTFERDGRFMVVSRGLGTHSINIRINDLPQIVVLRLEPG